LAIRLTCSKAHSQSSMEPCVDPRMRVWIKRSASANHLYSVTAISLRYLQQKRRSLRDRRVVWSRCIGLGAYIDCHKRRPALVSLTPCLVSYFFFKLLTFLSHQKLFYTRKLLAFLLYRFNFNQQASNFSVK
jgi:hypothetical protein